MARRISLSRAARLVGVKRGVLQQQIRAGELQTFEGEIVLADLLHAYPDAQIEVSLLVAVALRDKYGLTEVVGHDQISPGRKVDPGPAFDMGKFRGRMFGREQDDSDEHLEVSDGFASIDTGREDDPLNMRAWPSLESAVIEKIPHGTKVMVLRKNPGSHEHWSEIFYNDRKGWVVTRYLEGA